MTHIFKLGDIVFSGNEMIVVVLKRRMECWVFWDPSPTGGTPKLWLLWPDVPPAWCVCTTGRGNGFVRLFRGGNAGQMCTMWETVFIPLCGDWGGPETRTSLPTVQMVQMQSGKAQRWKYNLRSAHWNCVLPHYVFWNWKMFIFFPFPSLLCVWVHLQLFHRETEW